MSDLPVLYGNDVKVAKAFELVITGLSITSACQQADISRTTFYRALGNIDDNPGFKKFITQRARSNLAAFMDMHDQLLDKLQIRLDDQEDHPLALNEILALLAYLDSKTARLVGTLDLARTTEDNVILPSPALKIGTSRLRQNVAEANIELRPRPDGSVEIHYDVDIPEA